MRTPIKSPIVCGLNMQMSLVVVAVVLIVVVIISSGIGREVDVVFVDAKF